MPKQPVDDLAADTARLVAAVSALNEFLGRMGDDRWITLTVEADRLFNDQSSLAPRSVVAALYVVRAACDYYLDNPKTRAALAACYSELRRDVNGLLEKLGRKRRRGQPARRPFGIEAFVARLRYDARLRESRGKGSGLRGDRDEARENIIREIAKEMRHPYKALRTAMFSKKIEIGFQDLRQYDRVFLEHAVLGPTPEVPLSYLPKTQ